MPKKPKSNLVKMLKGERSSRIKQHPTMPLLKKLPKVPTDLDADAKRFWYKQGKILIRNRVLTEADILAFTYMCRIHSTLKKMVPTQRHYPSLFKILMNLFYDFGMGPKGRIDLKVQPPKKHSPSSQFIQ